MNASIPKGSHHAIWGYATPVRGAATATRWLPWAGVDQGQGAGSSFDSAPARCYNGSEKGSSQD